eukprot:CAMPEP_0194318900 /NCGR_PEP_ID=MMETSP0171-20130528/15443_1 /TAXON_ID=218684 /ORGANISM="Corethron pennatum, Strain L29A3" /LENGTH=764 /DNA_ID=CAMNT_0039075949 /DNA_START=1037 /DNA_END=3332 /DNA_ORIENTATION=+
MCMFMTPSMTPSIAPSISYYIMPVLSMLYLYYNGWQRFCTWFDYKSWYPLGRPVGTTIYPGLQVTAVFLKNHVVPHLSLNDVCCTMPAWFAAVASAFVGLLAHECAATGRRGQAAYAAPECGIAAAAVMAIVPAHLMRSIAGGFDNESLALTAMTGTYYLWVRSLRDERSWWVGAAAGVMYYYMVAVWGGYIFVLNMVGCHAGALVLLGRYSTGVYRSYSLLYVIGTGLAIYTLPVVGWTPLKSLEQMGPLVVFLGYQLIEISEVIRRQNKLNKKQAWGVRVAVCTGACILASLAVYLLAPTGYFGPLSARVRGLLIRHTRTGNPLVDSVAEHKPATAGQFYQGLHLIFYVAPAGLLLGCHRFSNASSFLLLYAVISTYFSSKMIRLMILVGPGMSALAGLALGTAFRWSLLQLLQRTLSRHAAKAASPTKKEEKSTSKDATVSAVASSSVGADADGAAIRRSMAAGFLVCCYVFAPVFYEYCNKMAVGMSHPTIMQKQRTKSGEIVMVDDYREAYWYLQQHTPEDARILAWWDYGYQIAGIANRTTLADGNTWNHEHVALLARALAHTEREGHRVARHLADYVLLVGGGGRDDLAKGPHIARIANSVYRDVCPGDPTCMRSFGFVDGHRTPSALMAASALYRLHSHGLVAGVGADPTLFRHVFDSEFGMVRIFRVLNVSKESKDFVADPANRVCDVKGGWFCRGQYPPGLAKVLSKAKAFSQQEDFNKKKNSAKDAEDEKYFKQYFEDMEEHDAEVNAQKKAP